MGTPSLHQGVCQDGRALSNAQLHQGVCQDGRALSNAQLHQGVCQDGRALSNAQLPQGVCQDGRALSTSHLRPGVCHDDRALGTVQLHPSVCHDDRASGAAYPHHQDPHRSCQDLRPHGGGGFGGGVESIPTSWESGGIGSSTKADLPELPCNASPLQFGDWIHLCGPVMRDLSSVASRWWDLTVRQAQTHYADWKQATPLQRVQIDPKIPEELNDRCYGRTEQRGVHLLLKSVSCRDPTDAGDGQAVDQHGNPLQALHQVPARGTWGEVTDFEGADAAAEDSDHVGAGNGLAELAEALWPSTRSWGQSS